VLRLKTVVAVESGAPSVTDDPLIVSAPSPSAVASDDVVFVRAKLPPPPKLPDK
jgi:hypothetical protein